jgi:hypothetical protein
MGESNPIKVTEIPQSDAQLVEAVNKLRKVMERIAELLDDLVDEHKCKRDHRD